LVKRLVGAEVKGAELPVKEAGVCEGAEAVLKGGQSLGVGLKGDRQGEEGGGVGAKVGWAFSKERAETCLEMWVTPLISTSNRRSV
jgi:hypothetical protein